MTALCIIHAGITTWYMILKKNISSPCFFGLPVQLGICALVCFLYSKHHLAHAGDTMRTRCTKDLYGNSDSVLFVKSFCSQKNKFDTYQVWEASPSSPKSILVNLCRSTEHVNWPQLSVWCVILDRKLSCALYTVFRHSRGSSVGCQRLDLWDSIVQMLLSQTQRFVCQREAAALILQSYMCHYACVRTL